MPDTPETKPLVNLNDCKKCGGYAVAHEQKSLPIIGSTSEFIVCCSICTHKGAWKTSAFEAARDWNDRNKPLG